MLNVEFFDEVGPLCLALHKSKLVAMKRIYKPNVALNREVLKELKQVICYICTKGLHGYPYASTGAFL